MSGQPSRIVPLRWLWPLLSLSACHEPRLALRAQNSGAAEQEIEYASEQAKLDELRSFYAQLFGQDGYSIAWDEIDQYRSGSGLPERKPFLDSWYPYSKGGTNAYGALSLYDRAFYQGASKAADWEATHHGLAEAAWWGHCDANAAATVRFTSPRLAVRRPAGCDPADTQRCTVFEPDDIRALLAEINKNSLPKWLAGGRPCAKSSAEMESEPFPRSRLEALDDCADANPAAVHAALTNFLGRMKQPLVFDTSADAEIWNYPVYSYSYVPRGPLTAAEAMRATGLSESRWIFNPRAASFYQVTLTVNYRASRSDLTGAGTVPQALTAKTYSYILELDSKRQVIGGEWIGTSRLDHPDFVWMPFEPVEPSGDTRLGNPFVSNDEVIKLWAESVGQDPQPYLQRVSRPPYGVLFYPQRKEAWGEVPGLYQILLDGSSTGATFLGKPTVLSVQTEAALKSEARLRLEIKLNGQSLRGVSLVNGAGEIQFDSKPGINVISLSWRGMSEQLPPLDREFRYFAM